MATDSTTRFSANTGRIASTASRTGARRSIRVVRPLSRSRQGPQPIEQPLDRRDLTADDPLELRHEAIVRATARHEL
jgi:hypothetical protein